MKRKKKKQKLKKAFIFKSFSILAIIISIIFFIMFVRLGVLPLKYLLLLLGGLGLIDLILYLLLTRKSYRPRMMGTLLNTIYIIILIFLINYQSVTLSFLHKLTFLNIETEIFDVISLKDNFSSLNELDNKIIGFVNDRETILKASNNLKKKINFSKREISDTPTLVEKLLDNEIDGIILLEEERKLYSENMEDFDNKINVLDTITIDKVGKAKTKNNVTKKPFNIYITGVDTYGKISNISRSDVNMVVTINPVNHKILLTSIPRDYYVKIHDNDGLNDKLTHVSLQGIDKTIATIEDLLDEDIDYYLKVNFSSLVKIVDELDGIDVSVPFDFSANYQEEDGSFVRYDFVTGQMHMDGKMALAYARERYSLREGDVGRARHQQQIIKSLVDKILSPKILTKYTEILKVLEGDFVTDLSMKEISSLIQLQLKDMPTWTIDNMVLTGENASMLTYTFPNSYAAVVIPNEEDIEEAIRKIEEIKANN